MLCILMKKKKKKRVKRFFPVPGHCVCSWPKSPTGVLSAQFCRERACRSEVSVTMEPLCSSGLPAGVPAGVPSCIFCSNLPLTFMMMTFPNHFSDQFHLKRWAAAETQQSHWRVVKLSGPVWALPCITTNNQLCLLCFMPVNHKKEKTGESVFVFF